MIKASGLKKTFDKWIIFQNNSIIAINKPCGIACQGGTGIKLSIDDLADEFYSAKLMHRIDKNVSGLLILAKNNESCSIPIENKTYYAVVIGIPNSSGKINDKIFNCGDRQKISEEGKDAITHFERLETVEIENNQYSLLKI